MSSAGFQIVYVLAGTMIAAKVPKSRCIIISILNLCSLAGIIMVKQLPVTMKVSRLGGLLLATGFAGGFPLSLSLIASNTAGYTKKTVVSAIFFVGYCAGNIVGPQTFYSVEAPFYPVCNLGLLQFATVCSLLLTECLYLHDSLFCFECHYSPHLTPGYGFNE